MMIELILQRLSRSKYGTFGELLKDNVHQCYTLEPSGNDNAYDTSCIPLGIYGVTTVNTEKFPYTHYAVLDVENRANIRIHRGNTVLDTDGCILVGIDMTDYGVWSSKDALDELTFKYPEGFNLIIKDIHT